MSTSDIEEINIESVSQESPIGITRIRKDNVSDLRKSWIKFIQRLLERSGADKELVPEAMRGSGEFTHGTKIPSPGSPIDWNEFKEIIGPNLKERMINNGTLRHSVLTALRRIKNTKEEEDTIKAVARTDPENPSWIKNLIHVKLDTQSLDEWKQRKKKIEKIAVESRAGNVKLHTLVERKNNETDVN